MDFNKVAWLFVIIALFVGFGIGLIPYILSNRHELDGYMVINDSDPDKDVYTLEMMIPFGEIPNRKRLTFGVIKDGKRR